MENALYQLKTCGKPLDGMSYIITCDNGSVLVIDGSYDLYDADLLLTWLKKVTAEEKPTVDAWFLTHAHPDHTFALKGMGERHNEELRVKSVVYAFPEASVMESIDPRVLPEIRAMEAAIDRFEGCQRVTPKRGDCFTYGSVQMKVLMTYRDLFAKERKDKITINDTSTVYRLEVGGQRILFPGDIQKAGDEAILELYGAELKSDVVQMAHHGCSHGSTTEFYETVDPSILLWPSNEHNFKVFLATVAVDQRLLRTGRVKDVIPAAHGSRKIPLPIQVGVAPFVPEVIPAIREVKPEYSFCRALDSDHPEQMDDPCWERVKKLPLAFDADVMAPLDFSAEFGALWTEDALYLRVRMNKKPVFDPLADRSHLCDNLRVYLSHQAQSDTCLLWYNLPPEAGFCDLKVYPENKKKYGCNCSRSDVASAVTRCDEDGWTALITIPFLQKRKPKDIIGFNLEANGFDGEKKLRSRVKSLIELKFPSQCVYCPAQMGYVELV